MKPQREGRIRKLRTRLMVAAEVIGEEQQNKNGNLKVRKEGDAFIFTFMDTDILKWDKLEGTITEIPGPYDATPSTAGQRRLAREAIAEYILEVMTPWGH